MEYVWLNWATTLNALIMPGTTITDHILLQIAYIIANS